MFSVQADCSSSPSTCANFACLTSSGKPNCCEIDPQPEGDVVQAQPVVGLSSGAFDLEHAKYASKRPHQQDKKIIISLDDDFLGCDNDSFTDDDRVKQHSSPTEVYDWLEMEVKRFEKLIAEKKSNIEISNKRSRELQQQLCDDNASEHTDVTLLTHLEPQLSPGSSKGSKGEPQVGSDQGSPNSPELKRDSSLQLIREEVIEEETPTGLEGKMGYSGTEGEASRSHVSLWLGLSKVKVKRSVVLQQSALGQKFWKQVIFYSIALGGFVFTLAATSTNLGGKDYEETDDHRRRLAGGVSPLMKDITFTIAGAGVTAWVGYGLYLPLMIGYLLGGVLVGPVVTKIVADDGSLAEIISFGIILVLFMVGLDLDVRTLFADDMKVPIVGFFQFPLCAFVSWAALTGLEELGLSFGETKYSVFYCAICCSISSATIVGGVLAKRADMDITCTTLTFGVLLSQVLWTGVVMLAQPHVNNFDWIEVLKSVVGLVGLIVVSLFYAKFIMPAVLLSASKSIELLLVVALSWCFFICTIGLLPFLNLPMELATIVSGACLASFSYSRGFNSKIKYIRDFFLTLFFAGLGTQIPSPTWEVVCKALLIAAVVLLVRWVVVFPLVRLCRGENRLAMMTTMNLSQVSELGMILAALGQRFGHINMATEVMLIWVFVLLAIPATPLCEYSYEVYKKVHNVKVFVQHRISMISTMSRQDTPQSDESLEPEPDRLIMLLGYHKIAHMLISELYDKRPDILRQMHVIHPDPAVRNRIEDMDIKFTCEDISKPERLMGSQKMAPALVICTLPGSMLELLGTSNQSILAAIQEAWEQHTPNIILSEEHPMMARKLYELGANYIVRIEKLCAERLQGLIASETTRTSALLHGGEFKELFEQYRHKDKDKRGASLAFNRQIS